MPLTLRKNAPFELVTLSEMLTDPDELALVNPNAKHPFDLLEWQEKWLNEPDDASFYVLDGDAPVGFFALRIGIGPEVRHLTYVYVMPKARGGAGAEMTALVEEAAKGLDALSVTLKVETENDPAHRAYLSAGFEELSRRNGMVTMRKEFG